MCIYAFFIHPDFILAYSTDYIVLFLFLAKITYPFFPSPCLFWLILLILFALSFYGGHIKQLYPAVSPPSNALFPKIFSSTFSLLPATFTRHLLSDSVFQICLLPALVPSAASSPFSCNFFTGIFEVGYFPVTFLLSS